MTYRAAIVDDDSSQASATLAAVARSTSSAAFSEVVSLTSAELEERCADGWHPDVVLLDIRLGDGVPDGIELARSLFPAGSGTQVIFVTGFIEYCTRVYVTEHVWFLVKPFDQVELDEALAHAVESLESDMHRPIALSSHGRTTFVSPRDIVYVESNRRKLHVHTTDRVIDVYGTLEGLARDLPAGFVQSHKSFLVNMDFVEASDADGLRLRGGQSVPVSQKRRAAVRASLLAFLRE